MQVPDYRKIRIALCSDLSDYHEASTSNPVDNLVVTGGYHNSTPNGGIFLHDPEYFDLAFQDVGSRISKN